MTLKITPGSIESDGHVVLMPAGLTGAVEVNGTTYDLGPAGQVAIEVNEEDAGEVALAVSQLAVDSPAVPIEEFDEAASRKNLNLNKKKG